MLPRADAVGQLAEKSGRRLKVQRQRLVTIDAPSLPHLVSDPGYSLHLVLFDRQPLHLFDGQPLTFT